jgi:hypothetical protein
MRWLTIASNVSQFVDLHVFDLYLFSVVCVELDYVHFWSIYGSLHHFICLCRGMALDRLF